MKLLVSAFLLGFALLPACAGDGDGAEVEEPEYASVDAGSDFAGDTQLHLDNAREYYDAGDYFRALDQFQRVLDEDGVNERAGLGVGFSYYNIGFNAAAYGNYKKAETNLRLAEEQFTKMFDGNLPQSTSEGTGIAWKSALGLAMTQRAIASADAARIRGIDSALNSTAPANVEKLLSDQKKLDARRAQYNRKALELFRRLAAMEFAAPDALQNLGDMELVVGNTGTALRAYERYLDVVRGNIVNWDKRRGEWTEAMPSQKYALEAQQIIDSKRSSAVRKAVDVLIRMAEINFTNGEYEKALAHLTEAAGFNPARHELHVPMAECNEKLGNYDKAIEHIDAYISATDEFDDNTRRAYKLRARLEKQAKG